MRAPVKRSDLEAHYSELLTGSLSNWAGISGLILTCEEAQTLSAKGLSEEEGDTEACLFDTENGQVLLRLDIAEALERVATSTALGVTEDDLSDTLESFTKIHRRALVNGILRGLANGPVPPDVKWLTKDELKLLCRKAPDRWFCKSLWNVTDIAGDKSYKLEFLIDRSALPESRPEGLESNPVPTLERLEQTLGTCRLPVRVTGGKIVMSIADCMKLEIGQIFGLPEIDFNAVDLKMPDSEYVFVQATLGNRFGTKAVRLRSGVDERFLAKYAAELEPN